MFDVIRARWVDYAEAPPRPTIVLPMPPPARPNMHFVPPTNDGGDRIEQVG